MCVCMVWVLLWDVLIYTNAWCTTTAKKSFTSTQPYLKPSCPVVYQWHDGFFYQKKKKSSIHHVISLPNSSVARFRPHCATICGMLYCSSVSHDVKQQQQQSSSSPLLFLIPDSFGKWPLTCSIENNKKAGYFPSAFHSSHGWPDTILRSARIGSFSREFRIVVGCRDDDKHEPEQTPGKQDYCADNPMNAGMIAEPSKSSDTEQYADDGDFDLGVVTRHAIRGVEDDVGDNGHR